MSETHAYSTGSDAFDRVLGGGFPAASTTVVAGLPGTGKTILAEQFLFANATSAEPALYLTTLSEPLDKTVRYLQRFDFFDPNRVPGTIEYQDLGQRIRQEGIGALPEIVEDLLDRRPATFVVIDSFKALHDLSTDPSRLSDLAVRLGAGAHGGRRDGAPARRVQLRGHRRTAGVRGCRRYRRAQ